MLDFDIAWVNERKDELKGQLKWPKDFPMNSTHSLERAPAIREERAQVWDLPLLRVQVTEYHAQVKCCPSCHQDTRATFPEGLQPISVQYGPTIKALAVYLHALHLVPYARTC